MAKSSGRGRCAALGFFVTGRMRPARQSAVALVLGCLVALPAAAQTVQERLPICLACHGDKGQSTLPDVPSLGGQQAFYVTVQLLMFRERMRVADPMNDMAKGLSDDDLQAIAAELAVLPAPRPPTDLGDPARLDRGRALVEQNHCNVCHRPNFSGQNNVPRVADQREEYLLKTLRDYKSGARHGYDATMAEVLQLLSRPAP